MYSPEEKTGLIHAKRISTSKENSETLNQKKKHISLKGDC